MIAQLATSSVQLPARVSTRASLRTRAVRSVAMPATRMAVAPMQQPKSFLAGSVAPAAFAAPAKGLAGSRLSRKQVSVKAAADAAPTQSSGIEKLAETLTTLFPVWVFLGAAIGITTPAAVTWFSSSLFTFGLGFLMLSMGLTLTFDDFRQCMRNPGTIGVGFLAQYCIKPLLGYAIAQVLGLSAPLATGLILVSCCPGGQASNVATYIAHGNVALSVLMTTASTVGAIFMTPLLTKLLAGQLVPVDAVGLAMSTFQVVLMPTLVGLLANEYANSIVRKITPILPLIGVFMTTLLCASPIGQVAEILKAQGGQLIIPVAILHAAAFSMGYFLSKIIGFSETTARTVSIETGMQSAALGFMLAQQHFGDPLVAVPSAVSVVFMALGGSALAVFWRGKPVPKEDAEQALA